MAIPIVAIQATYEGLKLLNNHIMPMVKDKMGGMKSREGTKASMGGFTPFRLMDTLTPGKSSNLKPHESVALNAAMRSLHGTAGAEAGPSQPSGPSGPGM